VPFAVKVPVRKAIMDVVPVFVEVGRVNVPTAEFKEDKLKTGTIEPAVVLTVPKSTLIISELSIGLVTIGAVGNKAAFGHVLKNL